ncbi:diguanylate cyclase [Methylobacterium sp. Leaf87]|uniref:GGDEF domain-containing protein n=1 Tax=Methylobacterium sp. Leaf87 TaxID=1736243 RepID=UPI0006F2AC5C|nr:diguanylate cyclase [Methylobacterium sp. Leaf87]KQO56239.1 diguanylate cyclase [Methylobacterium sp. Leaf87]
MTSVPKAAPRAATARPASDAFSLYDAEEAVIRQAETMLAGLSDAAAGVNALAEAYRRGYREQQRLVRMSDRMQLDLQKANHCLAEQRRDLQALNEALSREIEHRSRLEAELRRLADTDDLTGALARRRFMEMSVRAWQRHATDGTPITVMMLDLDRFKLVNDSFGHAAGDAALVACVAACLANLRPHDIIGRTGGEEFAVLLPNTALDAALAIAERLRVAVASAAIETPGGTVILSVSIGVAEARPGESLEAAMQRADAALYTAKDSGRDRVRSAPDALGSAPGRPIRMTPEGP